MDPELILALNKLADAHSRYADNVGRLADALTHVEGRFDKLSFADALIYQLQSISGSIEMIADNLPKPPEDD